MRAQNAMFHHGCQRRGHNHAGEHRLVQAADQFFQREGDGGNGRVKGRGDARRHSHRGHAPAILGAEPGNAREKAAYPGADLHSRAFHAQ